ncbi:Possible transcriptional regulatory protein [Alloactinosynnema sp. L-07]|uniref:class I SAM-dependent methyltransferase n=1 Tax=Alloactinosynnema sp. L-07 TaxID=1653480 RepID=UPI00065F085C|nr:class I SAM-dependent methyltransferase [Alloactinosynnema sp. L-07]CRK57382.1 Possible transcriptional regulatory protein [Alloactinosynnema sp. L-07]
MTTVADQIFDESKVEEFAGMLIDTYSRSLLTFMIDIGHRTQLFDATAQGPATSVELAERAGLQERYVREWLGALVTGGVFTYDPITHTYTLPAEHAACLCGAGSSNLAVVSLISALLGSHLDEVVTAFREGGGVSYEQFRPRFTDVMDSMSRGLFDGQLINGVLPSTGDLPRRLEKGIRVADIGCGTGHAVNLLATAYPASDFVGYDFSPDAIDRARAEAAALGLTNARFEVCDVAALPAEPLDAVFAFDAIHDQADPAGVLRGVYDVLVPDGVFVMFDIKASSNLEDNIGNPAAPLLYSVSVLHCMTVSLARDGAGLGTVWGEQLARKMLGEAGFEVASVSDVPDDPLDCVYLCRKVTS